MSITSVIILFPVTILLFTHKAKRVTLSGTWVSVLMKVSLIQRCPRRWPDSTYIIVILSVHILYTCIQVYVLTSEELMLSFNLHSLKITVNYNILTDNK